MAVVTDPQERMAQALATINTPDHAGRTVIHGILAAAAKKQRQSGTNDPIEIPMTASVRIGDPFGPDSGGGEGGGCITLMLNGVTVTICTDV